METPAKQNIGRKISRIRELKGLKQEALAQALGVSQQTVSNIENSEEIDDAKLKQVADVLGVSPEAIKNFSEEAVFTYFNNYYDNSQNSSSGPFGITNCSFNPLDKLLEAHEENKLLYERLLQAEKEKSALFESFLKDKC